MQDEMHFVPLFTVLMRVLMYLRLICYVISHLLQWLSGCKKLLCFFLFWQDLTSRLDVTTVFRSGWPMEDELYWSSLLIIQRIYSLV